MTKLTSKERRDLEALARPYATTFIAQWQQTISGIIQCGRTLADARDELPRGEWSWFVEKYLPISVRSAERLIKIWQSQILEKFNRINETNATPASHLPANWSALYELASLPDETFRDLVERGKITADTRRAEIRAAVSALSRPDATAGLIDIAAHKKNGYGAILADPPWRFGTWSTDGQDRSAERHYPTMSLDDIRALPVQDLAAPDCALFMWITSDMMPFAGEVMMAWGFDLKTTAFVWVKNGAPGMGYWTRKGSELCLLGTRGRPQRQAADVQEIIHAPRAAHSAKPAEAHDRIRRLVPGPYIELFARRPRDGWDAWGNEEVKIHEI